MRLPVRLELLLGFSLLSSGCDGKLAPTDRTAATLAPRSGVIVGAPPVSHRVWGIELAGTLVSHNRRAGDAGSVAWFVEGKADVAVGAQHSSLSATSWVDGTDIHERAFYVDNNGILQIRAIDNGVRTWLPSPLPQGALLRATTDAVVGSASVFAAALTTDGVPNLVVFSADKAPPGLYTVDSQHSGSPSPLDESSPIAGVAVASRYCFFTRTAADTINVAPGGSQWALPDSAARSALAATLYSGVEVLLFVGALDATVRLAVWSGGCDGAPSWVNLGTPGTALAAGRSSLAATSYLHPDHGLVVELLAVSTNGLVYRRIYSPALPGWLPWTPVGPIVSDGTSLPGALSAIAPTQIDASDAYSHAFFVVNESAANITYSVPPTGYLFEAFGGTVSNHTGAKTGFRTITSDTLD